MRRISQVLSNLIVLAEEAIVRSHLRDPKFSERLSAIGAEIRRVDALPAEHIRCTAAAMVMIHVIEKAREGGELAPAWLMLAGATLPLLRAESFVAMGVEREQQG